MLKKWLINEHLLYSYFAQNFYLYVLPIYYDIRKEPAGGKSETVKPQWNSLYENFSLFILVQNSVFDRLYYTFQQYIYLICTKYILQYIKFPSGTRVYEPKKF